MGGLTARLWDMGHAADGTCAAANVRSSPRDKRPPGDRECHLQPQVGLLSPPLSCSPHLAYSAALTVLARCPSLRVFRWVASQPLKFRGRWPPCQPLASPFGCPPSPPCGILLQASDSEHHVIRPVTLHPISSRREVVATTGINLKAPAGAAVACQRPTRGTLVS
jgi:hypothetical protein